MACPRFLVSVTDEYTTFSFGLPFAADLGISEDEKSTAAAFFGCLGAAAQNDRRGRRISADQARTLTLRPLTGTAPACLSPPPSCKHARKIHDARHPPCLPRAPFDADTMLQRVEQSVDVAI